MPKRFWKSLRSRILLLAVLTFLFLAAAAFSFFGFLRSSHTENLAGAERHLLTIASGMARSYAERPPRAPSLSTVEPQPAPRLPPPKPDRADPPDAPPPPPPPPPLPHAREALRSDPFTLLTARALRQEAGIEAASMRPGPAPSPAMRFPRMKDLAQTRRCPSAKDRRSKLLFAVR